MKLMSTLTHNTRVKLHNTTYNTTMTGTLHLPAEQYLRHSKHGSTLETIPRTVEEGTYGTHTITLPNGHRYRNTGTLTKA